MEYPLDEKRLEYMMWTFEKHGYDVKLVWMTPDEFLSQVPHPTTTLIPAIVDLAPKYFSQSSIKWITEAIMRNAKLDPLVLDYTSIVEGYPLHEGRHRAYVAKMLGIEKVPVVVVKEKG